MPHAVSSPVRSPAPNAPIALLSVSDKTGLTELAQALSEAGFHLVSTGGTAQALRAAGLPVTEIAELTRWPEMLDGRVKTLHPLVHGGLLARRDHPEHLRALQESGISRIDWLVVNLYPFEQTVAQEGCTLEQAVENIDIGGPAMTRSAAKNWRFVHVLTSPAQYAAAITALRSGKKMLSEAERFDLAAEAFAHCARYDGAISEYLSAIPSQQAGALGESAAPPRNFFPRSIHSSFVKVADMRYGENPHQRAAFYRDLHPAPGSLATAEVLQGKERSYNNIADSDAAWECVKLLKGGACVIVKHANPCGAALREDMKEAYEAALRCDPVSAFGGIIAFNQPVDRATAAAIVKQFAEVIIAPAFDEGARAVLAQKTNLRLLQISSWKPEAASALDARPFDRGSNLMDIKRIGSGLLMQTADYVPASHEGLRFVTTKKPGEMQMRDLFFLWEVARFVKSNAIVVGSHAATLGIGAGQMSRVDAARIACMKAKDAGLSLVGTVAASDAFLPFRDTLDILAEAGVTALIQPGGSMRDAEVIAAAEERGMSMVFTGHRHFRH